jgi:hypothetical protein
MKKLLITTIAGLALIGATVSVFGQGTVNWNNVGNTADTYATPALFGYGPGPYTFGTQVTGPSGTYEYGLYVGALGDTSISQMTLVSTYFNSSSPLGAGAILGGDVNLPAGFPNGTAIVDLVAGWTAADGGDYLTAYSNAPWDYAGLSDIGYVTPQNPPGRVFGLGPGEITGIYLGDTPEPGTIALGSLGAAAMLLFRRKKK